MSYYFRKRGDGTLERGWHSDRHSGTEKSNALDVLRGAVLILAHPYERDGHSGAGNCWCGRHEGSSLHAVIVDPDPRYPSSLRSVPQGGDHQ